MVTAVNVIYIQPPASATHQPASTGAVSWMRLLEGVLSTRIAAFIGGQPWSRVIFLRHMRTRHMRTRKCVCGGHAHEAFGLPDANTRSRQF